MAYSALGEWDKAEAALGRAHELALRSGDPVAAVDADLASSASASERGDLEEAVRLARSGAVRADALGAVACSVFANYLTGVAELKLGRPDRAIGPLQYSQDLSRENKIDMWRDVTQASMSASQCALGDISTAVQGWDRSLEAVRKNHDTGAEALIRYQRAKWLAATPDPDWEPILADFEASIALFRDLGLRPREVTALDEYAGTLERLGRSPAEASAARGRADDLLREMGIATPA
jgi:tetratricopeptide (TPR) repeat protein